MTLIQKQFLLHSVFKLTLTNEDLVVLDNDLQRETTEGILDIEDVHESENIGLKKDKILRIIDVLNDASDIASEFDIYYERAHVFKNSVFFQRKKNRGKTV